jgi:hypothetical protein
VRKVKITFFGFRVLKRQDAFFNNLLESSSLPFIYPGCCTLFPGRFSAESVE